VFALAATRGNLYVGGDFNNIGGQRAQPRRRRLDGRRGAVDGWNPGRMPSSSRSRWTRQRLRGRALPTISAASRATICEGLAHGSGRQAAGTRPSTPRQRRHSRVGGGGRARSYAGGEFFTIAARRAAYLARFPTNGSGGLDAALESRTPEHDVRASPSTAPNLYAGGAFNSIGGRRATAWRGLPVSGAAADGGNP
jgi:hypothetical protein